MRNIGIWLDKKKAHIVSIYNGKESLNTILSDVEDFHIHGGSGTRLKGGPQDVVQDSRYLEREKHQLKMYFDAIIDEIKNADEIVIFGPAETGEKFCKNLIEKHFDLSFKVKEVAKTDSMTKNQIKAWVKEFYDPKKVRSF